MKKFVIVIILFCFVSISYAWETGETKNKVWTGYQGKTEKILMSYPYYDWDYITEIYTNSDGECVIKRSDGSWLVTTRLEHVAIACQAYTLGLQLIVNWVAYNTWDAFAVMY
ncbi:MAG: hypothetical protein V2A69_11225 [Pseudomonadota bacterium]